MTKNQWLLPDGVVDVLFEHAQKQESLRDALLFILTAHGYRLVAPPLIEYTDTLYRHADDELKRQTFKLIDQLNGRTMGLRADITPQIMRIDAQHGKGIDRYCYIGQVVKTLPTGLFGLRTPMQLGAEIFGIENLPQKVCAELSLIDLLVALFDEIGMSRVDFHVDVGHVAIFNRLCALHGIGHDNVQTLMTLYNKKALPELHEFCQNIIGGADFLVLAKHTFGADKLPSANNLLNKLSDVAKSDEVIGRACHEIATFISHTQSVGMTASVDLTELSGYHYHTGLVFNVYLNHHDTAQTQALVRGGRYWATDTREATGFSMDINRLLEFVELQTDTIIWVDFDEIQHATDDELDDLNIQIKTLQDEGCVVIKPLSVDDKPTQIDGVLHRDNGQWAVRLVGDE
ncbi:ATP phosphoribosyltransferase regulatory subunit [Moraxella oblonga]|uniref:ATP phosphoribosyltransferase regulatory subunit n=1 Tax=Moraxella oblonga TaxID=200413 RepID=UPI000829721C|nr:ATP phosphoribosyltransferase regulatory subunit [Moraxella oblonga]